MKNISAIENIERACEQLDLIVVTGGDSTRLEIAKTNLSIALDKLRELEIKIRNL